MNDDRGGGALLGGDLVLVGPAAIVSHGAALKHFRIELGGICGIRDGRIVYEHDDGLALHIDALVVIPAILGSHNAVAHENHGGVVDLNLRHGTHGPGSDVFARRELNCSTGGGYMRSRFGLDTEEGNSLRP